MSDQCKVESILGISERQLVALSSAERATRFLTPDGAAFVNQETRAVFPFGQFETPSVAELKATVRAMAAAGDTESSPRARPAPPLTARSGVDIAELQSRLCSDDAAMVQVASNFNCLENGSKSVAPDCGVLVDHAAQDYTQGPAAVFPTLPAYLYRCHFHEGGQTIRRQVNLLRNVESYFAVPQNGKLTLTGAEDPIPADDDGLMNRVADGVCVGLHSDCPILWGRSKERGLFSLSAPGLTDHVLSASINLRDVGIVSPALLAAHDGDRTRVLASLCRTLLRGAYEGAYTAAIVRQRRALHLTLVGGGVFANPIPIIVEEIQRAHATWAGHPLSSLETVVVCLYSKRDEDQVVAALGSAA